MKNEIHTLLVGLRSFPGEQQDDSVTRIHFEIFCLERKISNDVLICKTAKIAMSVGRDESKLQTYIDVH